MIVLRMYGFTAVTNPAKLRKLRENLRRRISAVEALCVSQEDVAVFFPRELSAINEGKNIIIFVDGLFISRKRKHGGMDRIIVANIVVNTVTECFGCKKGMGVECIVNSFDPRNGSMSVRL